MAGYEAPPLPLHQTLWSWPIREKQINTVFQIKSRADHLLQNYSFYFNISVGWDINLKILLSTILLKNSEGAKHILRDKIFWHPLYISHFLSNRPKAILAIPTDSHGIVSTLQEENLRAFNQHKRDR